MKTKDLQKTRSLKLADITRSVVKKRKEIDVVSAKIGAGKEKNLKKSKNLKRDLAQMLTIIKEKEIAGKIEKVATKKSK